METNRAGADPLESMAVNASPTDTPQTAAQPAAPPSPAISQDPTPNATAPVTQSLPDGPGQETFKEAMGVGAEGEENIWEARYSMKNFFGRLALLGGLTLAWCALAIWVWVYHNEGYVVLPILSGLVLAVCWIALIRRIILARFGHYYRLTNRRVFVSTGIFSRRRDQMELLRVEDVYTKQSLMGRWIAVGSVVVVSSEPQFPIAYLTGVDDPKAVMDMIWHHARAERDRRSVKVDQI